MELLNQPLAEKLKELAAIDSDMRTKFINGEGELDTSIDEASQKQLMAVVNENGWPRISQVGVNASNAAWLLVQHAPSLDFMERCLKLMEDLPAGEVTPANIAYLKDRVLTMKGKPQIYGTQFQVIGKDMAVYPVEDFEHVDERRASVGLGTFAENERRLREQHKLSC